MNTNDNVAILSVIIHNLFGLSLFWMTCPHNNTLSIKNEHHNDLVYYLSVVLKRKICSFLKEDNRDYAQQLAEMIVIKSHLSFCCN